MNHNLLKQTEFHSFHWDNFSPEILQAHKSVMSHLGLNVQYTQKNIPHGQWLDEVMATAQAEVIAIIEPDLIPLNIDIVLSAIEYVIKNDTFLGCAQVSNHIGNATHIFASPAFSLLLKHVMKNLGIPLLCLINMEMLQKLLHLLPKKKNSLSYIVSNTL